MQVHGACYTKFIFKDMVLEYSRLVKIVSSSHLWIC